MKIMTIQSRKVKQTSLLLLPKKPDKIAIQLKERLEIITVNEILYCKADANYTIIYFENRPKVIVSKTLKTVCAVLSHPFIRIHQSYLVNIEKVSSIDTQIELINKIKLPISRAKKNATLEAIKSHFTII